MSQVDAKKTSKLLFESLYSAMKRGWTKKDINEIITRLNTIDSNMKVFAYRSALVAQLFGEIQKDKIARESKPLVRKAMMGEDLLNINDDYIEYHYPVVAKDECGSVKNDNFSKLRLVLAPLMLPQDKKMFGTVLQGLLCL